MASHVRGLIGFTVLALVGLGALVFFVVPALVRPLVVNAVHDALPFGDQALQVDVDVSGLGLVGGQIDQIHVTGTKLTVHGANEGVTIGALDVTVRHVSIGNHAFDAVSGGLDRVAIPSADGTPLTIARIDLSGGSTAVSGAARFDAGGAVAFVTRSLADQRVDASGIQLTDGGVSLVVFGQRVELALAVEEGALLVPDALGAGPITLLEPGPDDRWRLTGVSVSPDGMEIDAVIDAAALVAG